MAAQLAARTLGLPESDFDLEDGAIRVHEVERHRKGLVVGQRADEVRVRSAERLRDLDRRLGELAGRRSRPRVGRFE